MFARLLLLIAMFLAAPAGAQLAPAGRTAITPELIAEGPIPAGGSVDVAILMRPDRGWHGYWLNPGDAGQPMRVEWDLPRGVTVDPLAYPVPGRLSISGMMNYVYERDYALLAQVHAVPGIAGPIRLRGKAEWLACTDQICVPERGQLALDVPVGEGRPVARARFDQWRRALPRPLAAPAHFMLDGRRIRLAIALPASVTLGMPYIFPADDGPVEYGAPQRFSRSGDTLIAELERRRGEPGTFNGVLALGDGRGLSFTATRGRVPSDGTPIGGLGARAVLIAVLGALAGGLLLNLMPCVFPILTLKALHLARSGESEGAARRDALAYAAGAVIGTGLLGGALLALRASGSAAGWAFQLQDPRTTLLLMLLAAAIALNLAGLFVLPAMSQGGRADPRNGLATGALAAFVATPCAGPFLGTALGTALLLPAAGSVAVFAALGLGLALPFVAIAFVPVLRRRLPRPGEWMVRLQRFLAIPMAATAAGCLWLLWRQGGAAALGIGLAMVAILAAVLGWAGWRQRRGKASGLILLMAAAISVVGATAILPQRQQSVAHTPLGAEPWSEARVARHLGRGRAVFVYFTADWCLTCRVNESAAIDRDAVRSAMRDHGVRVLAGDWTNGDPAISRFLGSRGRAGVPLYLWYEPGRPPEELPQVLTPAMLIERAKRAR